MELAAEGPTGSVGLPADDPAAGSKGPGLTSVFFGGGFGINKPSTYPILCLLVERQIIHMSFVHHPHEGL